MKSENILSECYQNTDSVIHDVLDTLYLLNIAKNERWKYLLPLYKYHNIMNLEKTLAEAFLKHPEAHV